MENMQSVDETAVNWELTFATTEGLNPIDVGMLLTPLAEKHKLPLSQVMGAFAEYMKRRAVEQLHAEQDPDSPDGD